MRSLRLRRGSAFSHEGSASLTRIDRVVSLSSDIGGKRRSTMLELSGISLVSS
jgi:hypothetical protein